MLMLLIPEYGSAESLRALRACESSGSSSSSVCLTTLMTRPRLAVLGSFKKKGVSSLLES